MIGEIAGDTLTVTINRSEKRNAVTADGYHGIKRAAMIVADEPGLQFLVITGSGDVFCAGGDMNSVSNPDRSWDAFTEAYDATPFEALGKIPKIVLCAVNGIAMGGGTDVALETADAAFLHGRVADVARMVELSRRTIANIRANIAIALGLKAVFLVTTVLGVTGLWPAILADTGATVLVTANALRLLRAKVDQGA